MSDRQKKHLVFVPFPAQGHINPLLLLAKLLHHKGFRVTFINTESNHQLLIKSHGSELLNSKPGFRFETIPGSGPSFDPNVPQDIGSFFASIRENSYAPFKELLQKLNSNTENPPVSHVIADAYMPFAVKAAKALGIPYSHFWTSCASYLMEWLHKDELIKRGIIPIKESYTRDGTMEQRLDWMSGMKNMRVKDLSKTIRVTDLNGTLFNEIGSAVEQICASTSIIINTFEELESEALTALKCRISSGIYTVGPLHILNQRFLGQDSGSSDLSLWKYDKNCIEWLNKWGPNSVIYVNYGSIATMSEQTYLEFAWGLAKSKQPFLWIVRPDMVKGGKADHLPSDFLDEVKDWSFITSWCPQKEVLAHPSVGMFLSHCGWNSVLESISAGVPLICWPFFAEQPTLARYACANWGIGLELSSDVRRDEVAATIKEAMEGVQRKEMRQKVQELKGKAVKAGNVEGNSCKDFQTLCKKLS